MRQELINQVEIANLIIQQAMDDAELNQYPNSEVEESLPDEEMHSQPLFGNTDNGITDVHLEGGIIEYIDWFNDCEDSRYECN